MPQPCRVGRLHLSSNTEKPGFFSTSLPKSKSHRETRFLICRSQSTQNSDRSSCNRKGDRRQHICVEHALNRTDGLKSAATRIKPPRGVILFVGKALYRETGFLDHIFAEDQKSPRNPVSYLPKSINPKKRSPIL
jgi:hypothetical protein